MVWFYVLKSWFKAQVIKNNFFEEKKSWKDKTPDACAQQASLPGLQPLMPV